jgi:hypothetical protein
LIISNIRAFGRTITFAPSEWGASTNASRHPRTDATAICQQKTFAVSAAGGLIIGTALTIATIVGANAIILVQLHQNTLHDTQTGLLRQSLTLSELADRTFQSVDLVLASVVDKIQYAALTDSDPHQLANNDYHILLQEKLSGLPQIDTLGIFDAEGKRINHSHFWPTPDDDLSRRDYFQALKNNPNLTSFIGEPVRGNASGKWVIILARPVRRQMASFSAWYSAQ